ncbi:hypothetical protein GCM10027160_40360 [Streptomyces calidiresistens]
MGGEDCGPWTGPAQEPIRPGRRVRAPSPFRSRPGALSYPPRRRRGAVAGPREGGAQRANGRWAPITA